ncbi:hypothetical protein EZV62_028097 [Acer yangbiense]|uniref:Serine-threonine/tyrosine-protein kinase catalytic domain-containing protein n=1 Tax=Acer yangbiense TaxID=1000413 RepID=A0A5C7GNL7_9ROSI|nr:hypothetical protein EZV62_028097 [Acer yangbiense]
MEFELSNEAGSLGDYTAQLSRVCYDKHIDYAKVSPSVGNIPTSMLSFCRQTEEAEMMLKMYGLFLFAVAFGCFSLQSVFDYQAELSSLKIGRDLSTREVKDTLGFQHKYPELGRETPDSSGVSTRYCVSNRLTEKSDVYSFGVVLLEIITSKSAIIRINEREKTHLSQWVDSFLAQGDIRQIVDSRLQGNFNVNSVWKAVEVAMACLSPTANKRPTMNVVVTELNESLATEMCRSNKSDNCSDSNNSINHMVSKNFGNTEPNPRAR